MFFRGDAAVWLVAALLCVFMVAFQMSLGPVIWLVLSEIFPKDIRSRAMAVCTFGLWVANLVVATVFPVLMAAIGSAGTFAIFTVVGAASFLFIRPQVPETRGHSLEEIARLLERRPAAGG